MNRLKPVQNDDEAVKEIGCEIASEMCTEILSDPECDVDGVHFYTLNLERSATNILLSMGAIDFVRLEDSQETRKTQDKDSLQNKTSHEISDTIRANNERQFPWRPSAMAQRSKEEVRCVNYGLVDAIQG